jgi:hypothetical protein
MWCARAMILSKLGSASVWSSAFSTSIRISRPTRFRPTGTVNPRRSSGAFVGTCCCVFRSSDPASSWACRHGSESGAARPQSRAISAIGSSFAMGMPSILV